MATRQRMASNNQLEEAMALLIHNQAAFVEQIARNDRERIKLQGRSDAREIKSDERFRRIEEWQRKSEKRFENIEKRLEKIEVALIELPKTLLQNLLEQLPKAVKKEIGFNPRS